MAFKKMVDFNEKKYGKFFRLQDDGDSADVIFLYKNIEDAVVVETHYIKSDEYNGYVQHLEGAEGCPACEKNIKVQTKFFIPLYVLRSSCDPESEHKIQFWDRSTYFEPQFIKQVFNNYPNPSEYIFRITRHGAARQLDTTYDIVSTQANEVASYDKICADANITFPDYYNTICPEFSADKLTRLLNSRTAEGNVGVSTNYNSNNYGATPRAAVPMPEINTPDVSVPNIPQVNNEELPFGDETPENPSSENTTQDVGTIPDTPLNF